MVRVTSMLKKIDTKVFGSVRLFISTFCSETKMKQASESVKGMLQRRYKVGSSK